ncbi:MAG: 30S ribosomal protein S6e [DPANN group archaeon]|nr:30S ribosomal protein S6e [DPANN group archaeon]
MKLVISTPKDGKSYQIEIDNQKARPLLGTKIGNEVEGSPLGLTGYTLQVTGGTDKDGFPMRKDLHGTERKRLLLTKGTGLKKAKHGERRKKTIRGNIIAEDLAQINLKVLQAGQKEIPELLGLTPAEEAKPEQAETKTQETQAGA